MSDKPTHTEYRPRWHRPRMSTWWWLQKPVYMLFIVREISSAFIAWFVVFTLLQINAVKQGEQAYQDFQAFAKSPVVLVLNVVALFFVVFHAVTWFNLAPKAMVVRMGGQRVPGIWIAGSNYAAWAIASAVVAWFVLGG